MNRRRLLPTYHFENNDDGNLQKSVGKDLRNYKIYGESYQNGTPTLDNPIEIESVGDKTINLFDITQISNANIELHPEENYFDVKSYAMATAITPEKFLEITGLKEGDTFTTKCTKEIIGGTPSGVWGQVGFLARSGTGLPTFYLIRSGSNIGTNTIPSNFNSTNYIGLYIYGSSGSAGVIIRYKDFMIAKGTYTSDNFPDYEPYGYKIPIKVQEDKLPKGYTELEYITTTQNKGAYLNTGVIDNKNMGLYLKFKTNDATGSQYLMGARKDYNSTITLGLSGPTSTDIFTLTKLGYTSLNASTGAITRYANHIYEEEMKVIDNAIYMTQKNLTNGDSASLSSEYIPSTDSFANIWIGGFTNSNLYPNVLTIYRAKIYNGIEPIRDYIPCKNSDGVAGLFDIIQGKFYKSTYTTVPFTAGPEIEKTTDIYINEPLRKVGEYVDYIDFKNKKIVRSVGCEVLTKNSTKTISKGTVASTTSMFRQYFYPTPSMKIQPTSGGIGICSILPKNYEPYNKWTKPQVLFGLSNQTINVVSEIQLNNYEEFYNYLSNNGQNEVEFIYPLVVETEETIDLPNISTPKGDGIISVDTLIKPIQVNWQYYRSK